MRYKSILVIVVVFTLYTCIDPYVPKLNGYESLLVVDGRITDENGSFSVRLTKTIEEQNALPDMISDATVFVTDADGNKYSFTYRGDGFYNSSGSDIKGVVGRTYVLHINTNEGEVYESEPCLMQSVPDIDSIYFERDNEVFNNGTENFEGIRILMDTKGEESNRYYRWDFEETWKFKIPLAEKYVYINEQYIQPLKDVKQYCWKNIKSDGILIHQINSNEPDNIQRMPITFISPEKSDRLSLQYSILVRQYSISRKEYEFWNNLTKINETGDDIFAAQPYLVIGNIHNITNLTELVLGYFQVSAVKQKRKDIPFSQVIGLNLPYYHYPCVRIEDSPEIPPWSDFNPPLTWDDLYYMYTTSGYSFVEPKYIHASSKLDRLVFTKPECANCELTGTSERPVFWKDLN